MKLFTVHFSVFLLLSTLWLTTATHSHFSQDSWSYYELSRNIFYDFYHINTWRQFHIPSEYSISFPPLWPMLIAAINVFLHIGIYAGFLINFIIAAATFRLLRRMAKFWFEESEIGSLLFFALMITPDYTTAIFSAGTLPLGLLLLLTVLYLLEGKRFAPLLNTILLGIIAGLAVLNRFDFMLPAIVLTLFIRPIFIPAYLVAFFISALPWVAYSYHHFSSYWISDNSRTVLSSIPIFVRDYYPDGVPLLWDNPTHWMKKTIGAAMKSADVMFTTTTALPYLLGPVLWLSQKPQISRQMLAFGALIAAQLITILITGFVETRYYVPLQLFLLVALLWLSLPALPNPKMRQTISIIFPILSLLYATAYVAKSVVQDAPLSLRFNVANQQPLEFAGLQQCLGENAVLLAPPKNYSYKFGALTGIKTYVEPTNMSIDNASQFIQQFKPTHILTNKSQIYKLKSKPICSFTSWGEVQSTFYLYKL